MKGHLELLKAESSISLKILPEGALSHLDGPLRSLSDLSQLYFSSISALSQLYFSSPGQL